MTLLKQNIETSCHPDSIRTLLIGGNKTKGYKNGGSCGSHKTLTFLFDDTCFSQVEYYLDTPIPDSLGKAEAEHQSYLHSEKAFVQQFSAFYGYFDVNRYDSPVPNSFFKNQIAPFQFMDDHAHEWTAERWDWLDVPRLLVEHKTKPHLRFMLYCPELQARVLHALTPKPDIANFK
jgi:hypothetical protein